MREYVHSTEVQRILEAKAELMAFSQIEGEISAIPEKLHFYTSNCCPEHFNSDMAEAYYNDITTLGDNRSILIRGFERQWLGTKRRRYRWWDFPKDIWNPSNDELPRPWHVALSIKGARKSLTRLEKIAVSIGGSMVYHLERWQPDCQSPVRKVLERHCASDWFLVLVGSLLLFDSDKVFRLGEKRRSQWVDLVFIEFFERDCIRTIDWLLALDREAWEREQQEQPSKTSEPDRPRWDALERKLWFRGELVADLSKGARNTKRERYIEALENAGWPSELSYRNAWSQDCKSRSNERIDINKKLTGIALGYPNSNPDAITWQVSTKQTNPAKSRTSKTRVH